MLYFLVNNDYQLLDANRHAKELRDEGFVVSLILVPHSLQGDVPDGLYSTIIRLVSPVIGRRWPSAWFRYFLAKKEIDDRIHPSSGDVVLIYTEYEILNHLIINCFRAAGAQVVHIEDGGVGTYIPFSDLPGQALSLRELLIAASVKLLPGLTDSVFKKINGTVFPWRPDTHIDLLCVYRYYVPARRIRTVMIRSDAPLSMSDDKLIVGRVVFLNECIYDHYQDDASYLLGLRAILSGLVSGYPEVYFKFHPRESQVWRDRIRSHVLSLYPSIRVVEENLPVEVLLKTYAPEALASYFSTPLLNLSGTGIQPLYLYHLIDDLRDQPVFAKLTALLCGWEYQFVRSWDEVRAGYTSHIRFKHDGADPLTLSETLRTKLIRPVSTN